MVKYYHMIVQRGETRKEYISRKQGSSPPGWTCVGVCGFHECQEKKKPKMQ